MTLEIIIPDKFMPYLRRPESPLSPEDTRTDEEIVTDLAMNEIRQNMGSAYSEKVRPPSDLDELDQKIKSLTK